MVPPSSPSSSSSHCRRRERHIPRGTWAISRGIANANGAVRDLSARNDATVGDGDESTPDLVDNDSMMMAVRDDAEMTVRPESISSPSPSPSSESSESTTTSPSGGTTTFLQRGPRHVVAYKPPGVVCHHSGWAGSRSKAKRGEVPEVPMLQRVRDALHDLDCRTSSLSKSTDVEDGTTKEVEMEAPLGEKPMTTTTTSTSSARRVNLIHRLDRGASGCLLFAYADDGVGKDDDASSISSTSSGDDRDKGSSDTARLIEAMKHPNSIKTYVALVRGSGLLHGEDLRSRDWFEVNRPIKDDDGTPREASTLFKFVAGQAEDGFDRPRVSLVLARPYQGRWHQIRRHLNGISHPIIGDSTHGVSKVNREWREGRNVPGERIMLHLGKLNIVPTSNFPNGIDVSAPIPNDMLEALRKYAPDVLERSMPILEGVGIPIEDVGWEERCEFGRWSYPEALIPRSSASSSSSSSDDDPSRVEILEAGSHHVVVIKPPAVVVHHSSWTGGTDPSTTGGVTTGGWRHGGVPMLQRVRDETGRWVNPVHRLDRGASGCLLFSFAENGGGGGGGGRGGGEEGSSCGVTRSLMESMQRPDVVKTYISLCDGPGSWNGVNHIEKGWFTFINPVKDEWGKMIEYAETEFRFVASSILPPVRDVADGAMTMDDINSMEGRTVSIVLARPRTGRWHQIRQHLASGSIGHAILGDSSHGRSRTNRIWKKKRHLMKERVCLHLSRLHLPSSEYVPDGIDVTCPLPPDLITMLRALPTELLDAARPILAEEGITI
jgi:23S rRNA-/tRNA-specific pseudouridylate synthase